LINGALRWGVASEIRRLEAQLLPSSSSATPSAPPLPATVVETPDWFCVGCVGPRGAGKSTLLSLLRDAAMSGDAAAAAEAEALRIKLATQVPPLQSDERRPARVERVVRQATTAGVDVSVVPGSRLLLLEARPIDDVSLRSSGAAAPRMPSLRLLVFLLTVCDVVLVVNDAHDAISESAGTGSVWSELWSCVRDAIDLRAEIPTPTTLLPMHRAMAMAQERDAGQGRAEAQQIMLAVTRDARRRGCRLGARLIFVANKVEREQSMTGQNERAVLATRGAIGRFFCSHRSLRGERSSGGGAAAAAAAAHAGGLGRGQRGGGDGGGGGGRRSTSRIIGSKRWHLDWLDGEALPRAPSRPHAELEDETQRQMPLLCLPWLDLAASSSSASIAAGSGSGSSPAAAAAAVQKAQPDQAVERFVLFLMRQRRKGQCTANAERGAGATLTERAWLGAAASVWKLIARSPRIAEFEAAVDASRVALDAL